MPGMAKQSKTLKLEDVAIEHLAPHPKNYQEHPEDQLAEIRASIEKSGLYRNIVVARDNVILAGHGVVLALESMGLSVVPVHRLDVASDSPAAMRVLVADNRINQLAEVDDRLLSMILKDLKEADELQGTGFDAQMLANLVMVTRPATEIPTFNAAAEWTGLPGYEPDTPILKITVSFRSQEDRAEFARLCELDITEKTKSVWWPQREQQDVSSLRFDE